AYGVSEREPVARVLPDVDEAHVASPERDDEDDRSDERHREGREQRVRRRDGESPPALPGGVRARDQRVEDQAEGEEERGAPERGHQWSPPGVRYWSGERKPSSARTQRAPIVVSMGATEDAAMRSVCSRPRGAASRGVATTCSRTSPARSDPGTS